MHVKPHPTSPKYKPDPTKTVARVWDNATLDQPLRVPWWRVMTLSVLLAVAMVIGLLFGWGWLERHYPNWPWLQWLPLSKNTTVVRPINQTVSTVVPAAVRQSLTSLLAVTPDLGPTGVYSAASVRGLALALSSDGWLVTLGQVNSDTLTVLPDAGTAQTVDRRVTDPASAAIFLKVSQLSQSPVDLSSQPPRVGQAVWVATGTWRHLTAVPRIVTGFSAPAWRSTDRQDGWWTLDQPLTAPLGAPVMAADGTVLGLVGDNNRVWSVDWWQSAVTSVVQHGTADRVEFGGQYQMTVDITAEPITASGAIIGASSGPAVTAKGPADTAGLRSGDIITAVDGHELHDDLASLLQTYHAGDRLTLTVQRASHTLNLKVTLGRLGP